MPTRREFIKQTAAATIAAAMTGCLARGSKDLPASGAPATLKKSLRIKSIIRRDHTSMMYPCNGDNWHMSWAANDLQYLSLCDGYGLPDHQTDYYYNSRLLAIQGGPLGAEFRDVTGYPDLKPKYGDKDVSRYYAFGTLALDGTIYQFLTDFNSRAVKLIYSADDGRTWCNQDGTNPVLWNAPGEQSRRTMLFFDEPQQALGMGMVSIVQMGRGYEHNQDGFVYGYAPREKANGSAAELHLFRVHKRRILERSAYEFFTEHGTDGSARWTRNIEECGPVMSFDRGTWSSAYSWLPSVTYNAPLGQFMMSTWAWGVAPDRELYEKPSYLGVWVAENPWGPWRQVHEEKEWLPNNDPAARAYQPQIAPKWIAPDGKSFWLVWTDYRHNDELFRKLTSPNAENRELFYRCLPNYFFNVQRVDIVLG
ncbi:MAG: DUF4185 domain-containing protein [Opitutaceae bacterium]